MRYVALGRVSTQQQSDNYSRAVQFEAIHSYAKQQNWTPVAEFFDTASGSEKGLSERDGLTQALAFLRVRKADYLIMNEVSRLGREATVIKELIERVYEYGGKLGVASERRLYDSALEAQELLFWQGAVSQYEYLLIKRRTSRGKKKAFEAGSYIWTAIFGYRVEKVDGIKQLVVNPDEAEVIREICERFAAGETKSEIARWSKLSLNRIIKMLKEDTVVYAGGTRLMTITLEGVKYERNQKFPAIITTDLLTRIKELNRVSYRQDRQPTPFLGIIECYCGGSGSSYVNVKNRRGVRRVQIACSTVVRARARRYAGNDEGHRCKHSLSARIITEELFGYLNGNLDYSSDTEALSLVIESQEEENRAIHNKLKELDDKRIELIDSLSKIENLLNIAEVVDRQLGQLKEEEARLTQHLLRLNTWIEGDRAKLKILRDTDWPAAIESISAAIKKDEWKIANDLLNQLGIRIAIDFNNPNPRQTIEVRVATPV